MNNELLIERMKEVLKEFGFKEFLLVMAKEDDIKICGSTISKGFPASDALYRCFQAAVFTLQTTGGSMVKSTAYPQKPDNG